MISELRSALATANEKIRNMEAIKTIEPDLALPPVEEASVVSQCLKCSGVSNEDTQISVPSDTLAAFPSQELKLAKDAWNVLLHDKREIQHKIASLEQLEKDFEYKIMLKNQKNDRVENISLSTLR